MEGGLKGNGSCNPVDAAKVLFSGFHSTTPPECCVFGCCCKVGKWRGVIGHLNTHILYVHAVMSILNPLGCSYGSILQKVCRRPAVCLSLCLSVCCFSALILLFAFLPCCPPPPLLHFLCQPYRSAYSTHVPLLCSRTYCTRMQHPMPGQHTLTHTHTYSTCVPVMLCLCVCVHLGDAPLS